MFLYMKYWFCSIQKNSSTRMALRPICMSLRWAEKPLALLVSLQNISSLNRISMPLTDWETFITHLSLFPISTAHVSSLITPPSPSFNQSYVLLIAFKRYWLGRGWGWGEGQACYREMVDRFSFLEKRNNRK